MCVRVCRRLRAEKDRELSAARREQGRKEYEVKKLTAINAKQQMVIARKTEALQVCVCLSLRLCMGARGCISRVTLACTLNICDQGLRVFLTHVSD